MSGTLIPLGGTAVDPFKLPAAWNNILATQANTALTRAKTATEQEQPALAQAQTGLASAQSGKLQAETIGQQINNAFLGYQNQAKLNALVSRRNQDDSSYSSSSSGGTGATSSGGDGSTGWDALGGAKGTGTGDRVAATALDDTSSPSPAPNALAMYGSTSEPASGADGGRGGGNAPGIQIEGVTGPVPRQVGASYDLGILKGSTGIEQAEQINKLRASRILQAATAGRVSPQAWNMELQQLVREGWMDPAHEAPLLNHPELYDNVVRQYGSADSLISQQTAMVGHGLRMDPSGVVPDPGALSTKEWQKRSVPILDADGKPTGRFHDIMVPPVTAANEALRAGGGAPAPGGAAAAQPGAAAAQPGAQPFEEYMARVKGAEVGGRAGQAAVNAASGATGDFQWMPGTWAQQMRKNEPQLAAGKSDAELFAMLKTPEGQALEPEMMRSFTAGNAAALEAKGRPVNMSSLYLAHWFGPAGIDAIGAQKLSTPLADVQIPGSVPMSKIIAQNPVLRGKTVGQLVNYVSGRFGLDPVNLGGAGGAGGGAALSAPGIFGGAPSPAPAGPAGAAAAPPGGSAAVAPPGADMPTGAVSTGPDKLNPEQEKALEVQTEVQKRAEGAVAEAYGTEAGNVVKASNQAPITLERVDVLQNAAEAFRTGFSGPQRATLASGLVDAMQSLGLTPPQGLLEGAGGAEVINKLGGFMAANMVKMMGEKAASVFDAVKSIQPNIAQTTDGFKAILQSVKMDAQRDQALGRFQEDWLANKEHNHSTVGMMTEFNKQHPIEQYASRVRPYPVPTLKSGAVDESKLKDNTIYQNPSGAFALRLNNDWVPPVRPGDAHHFEGKGGHILE